MSLSGDGVLDFSFSERGLTLVFGGLFLLGKSTHEIHANLEGENPAEDCAKKGGAGFMAIMVQIALIDIVFSLAVEVLNIRLRGKRAKAVWLRRSSQAEVIAEQDA